MRAFRILLRQLQFADRNARFLAVVARGRDHGVTGTCASESGKHRRLARASPSVHDGNRTWRPLLAEIEADLFERSEPGHAHAEQVHDPYSNGIPPAGKGKFTLPFPAPTVLYVSS